MKKMIDWNQRTAQERELYSYYLSLGYDKHTATVLALFTFGDRRILHPDMEDLYKKVTDPVGSRAATEEMPPALEPYDGGVTLSSYADADLCEDGIDPDSAGGDGILEAPDTSYDMRESAPAPRRSAPKAPFLSNAAPKASFLSNAASKASFLSNAAPKASFSSRGTSGGGLLGSIGRAAQGILSQPSAVHLDTDEYESIEEKDFREVVNHMTSTFRMTTNTASAGVVLNQLRNDRRISKDMVRIEEMLNYFRYKSDIPSEEKFRISYELMPSEDGHKLLYINVQGREEVKPKQNIVVLMDVSGSMTGNVRQVQAVFATIVSKLNPGDRISLVTYSTRDEVVFGGMPITSDEDRIRALEEFLGVEIYGYTNGSAGINEAYRIGKENYMEDGNNQVILITDGDLNFGITDKGGLEQLIGEKKKSNLFLSVIGTGLSNYKDDKLEVLCKHGNGVYRTVNNLTDVKKCIDREYASLVNIIAKDVKAQVEFNPEMVESFRLLGFENRELSHEDFVNDKVISEPFGSGGYGVALYDIKLKEGGKTMESGYKYAKVVTTGSPELGTVRVRYKEPLGDRSEEIECVIPSAQDAYTDNTKLAYVVYVCAEKLRGSDKITGKDEKRAMELCDELGEEIREMNKDDLYKLPEILRRSPGELNVGIRAGDRFKW